jgi:hypothetical protein
MGDKGGRKLSRTTYMDSYGRQPWRDHTGNFWDSYVDGKPQPSSTGQDLAEERQHRTTRHFKAAFFVTVVILCIGGIAAAAIYGTHSQTAHSQTRGAPTTLLTTPTKPTTPTQAGTPTTVYQYLGNGQGFLDMGNLQGGVLASDNHKLEAAGSRLRVTSVSCKLGTTEANGSTHAVCTVNYNNGQSYQAAVTITGDGQHAAWSDLG